MKKLSLVLLMLSVSLVACSKSGNSPTPVAVNNCANGVYNPTGQMYPNGSPYPYGSPNSVGCAGIPGSYQNGAYVGGYQNAGYDPCSAYYGPTWTITYAYGQPRCVSYVGY